MAQAPAQEAWLIFIDTNIMLDFYRMPGESAERQIRSLENHLDSVIVTEQVKMEFMKNRQKVIRDSINNISKPDKIELPMIVTGLQAANTLKKKVDETSKARKRVSAKVERILREPSTHDPVFKGLKKLFAHKSDLNLKRPDPLRFKIRRKAWKRFILGYPPRKGGDTSIGDALNWEWIIHCAEHSKELRNILIVSRDGDFGLEYRGSVYINDWLEAEFKNRISQKRKIVLTNKLSDALRKLAENVTEADEKAEEELISSYHQVARWSDFSETSEYTGNLSDFFRRYLLEQNYDPPEDGET